MQSRNHKRVSCKTDREMQFKCLILSKIRQCDHDLEVNLMLNNDDIS